MVYIDPLSDESKKQLFKAVADRGYANGLTAAAEVLKQCADGHMRVVGTNTIRDIAEALAEKATALRLAADAKVAALEAESK